MREVSIREWAEPTMPYSASRETSVNLQPQIRPCRHQVKCFKRAGLSVWSIRPYPLVHPSSVFTDTPSLQTIRSL